MSLVSKIKNDIQEARKTAIVCNNNVLNAMERDDESACAYWQAKAANAHGKITALESVLDWIQDNIIGE